MAVASDFEVGSLNFGGGSWAAEVTHTEEETRLDAFGSDSDPGSVVVVGPYNANFDADPVRVTNENVPASDRIDTIRKMAAKAYDTFMSQGDRE